MKNSLYMAFVILLAGCNSASGQTEDWTAIFNGKDLEGWETYLGPEYDPEKNEFTGDSIGLNRDPKQVFSVVEEDGESALRISGEQFGGISTLQEFENYHLQVQFKWGKARYAPRDSAKRDSGILYHAHGPHGKNWFFWMASQEFQVQEGDCGDYWGLSCDMDVRASMQDDSSYRYDPKGELLMFGTHSELNNNVKKYPEAENPSGEWNTLDLYVRGDTSFHVVNGRLTMVLFNSREMQKDGSYTALTRGKIQIQSEGAEVFYRNIRWRPLSKFPGEFVTEI